MSKIIIDNWTIERASVSVNDYFEEISDEPSSEYASLIEAIILWDEVCYFDNSFSHQWKRNLERFQYEKYLKGLEDFDIDSSKFDFSTSSIIERGAIEYVEKCNSMKVSCLLTDERVKYLEEIQGKQLRYCREELMKRMDERLNEYYQLCELCNKRPKFPAFF